jgi:molybdate transport repressor ModE-like protein
MELTPTLTWQLPGDPTQMVDPRLLPLLAAIAETSSLAAAVGRCGVSYRAAWGLLRDYRQQLGAPLVELERARGARLTPLGERWLGAHGAAIERLRRVLPSYAVEIAPSAQSRRAALARVTLAASHDLALAEWATMLPAAARVELDLAFMGSLVALREYAAGRAAIAGFHVPIDARAPVDLQPFLEWLSPRRDRLIRFVDREQGLILPRGNPRKVKALRDVAAKHLRFVNRQRGSGTRHALDEMLAAAQVSSAAIDGYAREEFTHAAVAATVASGGAEVGFGLRAAAAEYGLAFVPLLRERYFLAVRARALETAPIKRLVEALRGVRLARVLRRLPGYASEGAGSVVGVDALSASTRPRIRRSACRAAAATRRSRTSRA